MNNAFTDYINKNTTTENLHKRMKDGKRYLYDEITTEIDVSKKSPAMGGGRPSPRLTTTAILQTHCVVTSVTTDGI
ncbi:MAG: hypothetical protein ABSG84_05310 [Acidobacteriaceae bacterium]|jgi:hypothetical protein